MSELLLELRFQDMPPERVEKLSRQLTVRLFEDFMGRGMGPAELITGRTPRRVLLCLKGLPDVEPDREERQLGPPEDEAWDADGEPSEALRELVERSGMALDELSRVPTERGTFMAAVREVPGRPLVEVLNERLQVALSELTWWSPVEKLSGLHGLVSLLDGEVLPAEVLGLTAGASTAGHPVLSPESFEVKGLDDYREHLRQLGIEVELVVRRRRLAEALAEHASQLGGELVGGDELIDRFASLCEIPGVVAGNFDPSHLELPEEILLAALTRRAQAFAVRSTGGDAAGELLPHFLTFMDRADDPAGRVRAGHERAVAGHLVDISFRYHADRRATLAERSRKLHDLELHPRLGSTESKGQRLLALVELLCGELGWEDELPAARQAAELLKADLTCGLVRDFPELRGTVGGIFAREEGYPEEVWRAIYEHYSADPIPATRAGRVVALADRLDSLVGFVGIEQLPKSGKDPFSLRRLARGLLRIVVDGELELDLDLVVARAVLLYGDVLERGAEELLRELQTFLGERLRHLLGQRGFAHDEIEAAAAISTPYLPELVARVRALAAVREEPEFRSLVLSAKRIFNIVKDSPEYELRAAELAPGAEQDLSTALEELRPIVDRAVSERRYEDCLREMVSLVPHLDRFFADVLVMDENERLKANRIALLQACRRVFWRIARLKEMAVEKE